MAPTRPPAKVEKNTSIRDKNYKLAQGELVSM
jgi:hypothetical protein